MSEFEEKKKQVSAQYWVCATLASDIARLCYEIARMYDAGHVSDAAIRDVLEQQGKRSHFWMNELGDMQNAVDAVPDGREWMDKYFEKARELFPLD